MWIGYVDGPVGWSAASSSRWGVEGGRVTAFDHSSDSVRSYSVHRVTGVAPASLDESPVDNARPKGQPDR